jgi:polysaccharide export outer membrane protein
MAKFCSMLRMLVFYSLVVAFLATVSCSCGSTKRITYMQGKFDTAKYSQVIAPDPLIQKGDLLSIVVYSDNPEATRIYNQALITGASASASATALGTANDGITGTAPTSPGYRVAENGNIEFQGLGLLHIDGLTRSTLKDTLDDRLKPFLTNPYYSIRFLNARFTMLGEVTKPGIYTMPGDRLNLFQALGMAGDMTFYGRRDSVLVIRETDGKREYGRLDMTKPEILGSPYFYVHPNDIVIFAATKNKVVANDQTTLRNVSIATSLVSVFAIIYTIFRN